MSNKALEGIQNERDIVVYFNKNKKIIEELGLNKPQDLWAIHITSKKYGKLNDSLINCKADLFIAKGIVDIQYLEKRNYYLNEIDVIKFNLTPIEYTGVSVKLCNSRFTIFKMGVSIFKKLFGSNVLAAGASIYSTKDFHKNESVLRGWEVSQNQFRSYFIDLIDDELDFLNNKEVLSRIKTSANEKITEIITSNKTISDFVFKGIGNFEEPFTASWLIEDETLKVNYEIPFSVTTGSGRSKGVFTVVLKPR